MERYKVELTEPAEQDFRGVYRYIATELSALETAFATMKALETAMRSLQELPKRNPLVRDERLAALGYRRMIAKNYSIFYRVEEKKGVVYIVRILYNRCDWQSIL